MFDIVCFYNHGYRYGAVCRYGGDGENETEDKGGFRDTNNANLKAMEGMDYFLDINTTDFMW